VIEDHERIEELLASHALLALDGEDAAEAERLLAEHVPSCATCRRTVADHQVVAGDLGLAADPAPPPDLVLARIHRDLRNAETRRRSPLGSLVAIAAGVLALVAMGALSVSMMDRASDAEDGRTLALELVSLMRSPGVDPVSVDPQGTAPTSSSFVGVPAPDVRSFYLAADVCPEPRPGHAYQLWLGRDGSFSPAGDMFVPSGGTVLIKLTVDVSRYDEVWITEEETGAPPSSPSADGRSWRAALS
jgi:hypothetical protein